MSLNYKKKELTKFINKESKRYIIQKTRIECYHHGADCRLKFIHRYYLNTLDGPLLLVVVLVFILFDETWNLRFSRFGSEVEK